MIPSEMSHDDSHCAWLIISDIHFYNVYPLSVGMAVPKKDFFINTAIIFNTYFSPQKTTFFNVTGIYSLTLKNVVFWGKKYVLKIIAVFIYSKNPNKRTPLGTTATQCTEKISKSL